MSASFVCLRCGTTVRSTTLVAPSACFLVASLSKQPVHSKGLPWVYLFRANGTAIILATNSSVKTYYIRPYCLELCLRTSSYIFILHNHPLFHSLPATATMCYAWASRRRALKSTVSTSFSIPAGQCLALLVWLSLKGWLPTAPTSRALCGSRPAQLCSTAVPSTTSLCHGAWSTTSCRFSLWLLWKLPWWAPWRCLGRRAAAPRGMLRGSVSSLQRCLMGWMGSTLVDHSILWDCLMTPR